MNKSQLPLHFSIKSIALLSCSGKEILITRHTLEPYCTLPTPFHSPQFIPPPPLGSHNQWYYSWKQHLKNMVFPFILWNPDIYVFNTQPVSYTIPAKKKLASFYLLSHKCVILWVKLRDWEDGESQYFKRAYLYEAGCIHKLRWDNYEISLRFSHCVCPKRWTANTWWKSSGNLITTWK